MLAAALLSTLVLADPAATIFVDFDGADLDKTEYFELDDSRTNTSWLFGGHFAPYGFGSKKAAVLQAVRADWAAYDIAVTDVRPSAGEYTTSIVTPTNPTDEGIIGYAPVDCWDEVSSSNITFAFHSADDNYGPTGTATTISQEVAHSFGLEHVADAGDIMHPTNSGDDPEFVNGCSPLVGDTYCDDQHDEFCAPGQQNSHAELMAMFGPARGDKTTPLAQISEPAHGDVFDTGDDVVVVVDVSGDASLDGMELFVDGASIGAPEAASPFRWTVEDLNRGEHSLHVVSRNADGTESVSGEVRIGIDVVPKVDEALARGEEEEDALSCSVGGRRGAPPVLGLGLLLGFAARRRRAG